MYSTKPLHLLNAALWVANAAVWSLHAHSVLMTVVSLAAAVGSLLMARSE